MMVTVIVGIVVVVVVAAADADADAARCCEGTSAELGESNRGKCVAKLGSVVKYRWELECIRGPD